LSLSDYLLGTLGVYGVPALFAVLLVGSIGVPMPASLLLLVAGSFVAQGELSLWQVLLLGSAGAIIGDNIGYALGRWGGHHVARRISRWTGGEAGLRRADVWLRRWAGAGIFLSRWLLTPLGPLINLTSGMTDYPWPRFLLYDVLGEALWVGLYVLLGKFFSDRVQVVSEFFGDFTWMIVGLVVVVVLGRQVVQMFRVPASADAKAEGRVPDAVS
jgi:membrane-associated protein